MLFAVSFGSMLIAVAHHQKVIGKSSVNLRTNISVEVLGDGDGEAVHAAERQRNDVLWTTFTDWDVSA
jgi:hypothetical protein